MMAREVLLALSPDHITDETTCLAIVSGFRSNEM